MAIPVDFDWDERKAAANLAKHGVGFDVALAIFLDERHVVIDATRGEDGERRNKVVGQIAGRVFTMVFVMRAGICRVISARRANTPEERAYDRQE